MKAAFTRTLNQPVEVKNKDGEVIETITTVTINRPKGKNFRAMDGATGQVGMTLALLGSLANLPPSTVDLIDGEDLIPLLEVVGGFFPSFLQTGAK